MVDGQAGKGDQFRSVDMGIYGKNYDAIFRKTQEDVDEVFEANGDILNPDMLQELVDEAADDYVSETNDNPLESIPRERLENLVTLFTLGIVNGDDCIFDVADRIYEEFLNLE